jgi:hypothetical protein
MADRVTPKGRSAPGRSHLGPTGRRLPSGSVASAELKRPAEVTIGAVMDQRGIVGSTSRLCVELITVAAEA